MRPKLNNFRKIRILTTSFVSATVAIGVTTEKIYLAIIGIAIGILFLSLVKRRSKEITTDERIVSISGRAARLAFTIVTVTLSALSLLFIVIGRRTGDIYLEALGTVFSYIACLSIAVYSISYKYIEKSYDGED